MFTERIVNFSSVMVTESLHHRYAFCVLSGKHSPREFDELRSKWDYL